MAKAPKATHAGTCQVCGRMSRLPGGVIAKHGYQLQGYFSGTCRGTGHPPLEETADLLPKYMRELEMNIMAEQEKLAAIAAGEMVGLVFAGGYALYNPVTHAHGVATYERGGRSVMICASDSPELVATVERLSQDGIRLCQKLIGHYQATIKRLKVTLANWRPGTITEL